LILGTPVTIVNVARERHQRKQVEAALRFAEEEGCRVEVSTPATPGAE